MSEKINKVELNKIENNIRSIIAPLLAGAFERYKDLFGVVPHGTEKQMGAMAELGIIRELASRELLLQEKINELEKKIKEIESYCEGGKKYNQLLNESMNKDLEISELKMEDPRSLNKLRDQAKAHSTEKLLFHCEIDSLSTRLFNALKLLKSFYDRNFFDNENESTSIDIHFILNNPKNKTLLETREKWYTKEEVINYEKCGPGCDPSMGIHAYNCESNKPTI